MSLPSIFRLPPAAQQKIYHAWWQTLDWVFPPRCIGCGTVGERFCPSCQNDLLWLPQAVCLRCGKLLRLANKSPVLHLCQNCRAHKPAFQSLRACVRYTGVGRKAVLAIKYHRDLGLAEVLAELLYQRFCQTGWNVDLITCVPLSAERLRRREYNQTALMAYPLSLQVGIPFIPLLLRKTRETPSQVGLSMAERKHNVRDAFHLGSFSVRNQRVLVIDDVATSGATMNACAAVLREGGARAVFGLAFARGGLAQHYQPEFPDIFSKEEYRGS